MKLKAIFFLPGQSPLDDFYKLRSKIYERTDQPDEINLNYVISCLLICQDNEPVARLCLYHNPAIENNETLLFGNIEFVNDKQVFEKLITEAEQYAYQNGYNALLGPVNGSTWDEYRLPITNEGRQFITDLQQPLYYAEYLIKSGYQIVQRYFTQQSKLIHQDVDKTVEKKFQNQGVYIHSISLNDYENELRRLYPFCTNAFSENVYYSEINKSDFIAKYKMVQPFLNPEFVLIAENKQQEIVAFLLCIPDVYQSNTIVMKTMARNNDIKLRGLMTHVINMFYNRAVSAGYTHLLHAFFHEDNRSGILSEKYNGQPFKSYALFQKKLSD